jgi:signal transduction histidine kinase
LLIESSKKQIREIGNLFREDIEIMLEFGDVDGMNDILNRILSLENVLGIGVSQDRNIEFQNGNFEERFLKFEDISLFENLFIYNFQIGDSKVTLVYSADYYLETLEVYKTFSLFLAISLLLLGVLLFLSIRNLISFFEKLSKKLQNIDFQNFKKLDSIEANDERRYILIGVNELLLRVQSEMRKSREKDRVMFQQARLAQMGEMIGNIAHQWRQPLNEIALLIQSFEMAFYRDKLDEDFLEKRLEESEELIDKMSQTIDDFREFFNPNKEKTLFSLNTSIYDSLKLLQASFESSSISVNFNFSDEVEFFGFKNEFEQVILNILSNSKDVLENSEKREIEIEIVKGKNISISISDSGGGIPVENLSRVFEPYFTTKEQGKGTGIGLYMSKSIIEAMGGEIRVWNSEIGATFEIELPKSVDV